MKSGYDYGFPETISFDPNTPIRAVSGTTYLWIIRFLDNAGKEVYVYNPTNDSGVTTRTTTY